MRVIIKNIMILVMNEKIKIYSLNISVVLILSFISAHLMTSIIDFFTRTRTEKANFSADTVINKNYEQVIINWDRILNSGFFRTGIPQDSAEIEIALQPAGANISELKLVGTITGDWEYSRAMIRNRNSQIAEIFKINQNVYGYKLSKINDYDIVLKLNGQIFKLEMYGDENADSNSQQQAPSISNQAAGSRTISKSISRASIQQKIQGNMDNMLRGLKIGPFRENNTITGYTLISVDPSNVLFDVGARSGDIIKRINGHPASSTEKIFELWKSFNSESKFIIDIERNNSIYTYDINITD